MTFKTKWLGKDVYFQFQPYLETKSCLHRGVNKQPDDDVNLLHLRLLTHLVDLPEAEHEAAPHLRLDGILRVRPLLKDDFVRGV